MSPWSCQMDKYWPSYGQIKIQKKFLLNVAYNTHIFPTNTTGKTCGLNISRTSCDSSTHFVYFNSWQKVDRETSVVKFGHYSRAYLEGLTKSWGFGGSSALYSPFCTWKPIHLTSYPWQTLFMTIPCYTTLPSQGNTLGVFPSSEGGPVAVLLWSDPLAIPLNRRGFPTLFPHLNHPHL